MISSLFKWIIKNKIHVLVWGVFLSYELTISKLALGTKISTIVLVHYFMTIMIFYLFGNKLFHVFRFNSRLMVFNFPILTLAFVGVYISLHYLIDFLYYNFIELYQFQFNAAYFLKQVYRGIYFMGFATGYYFLKTYLSEKKKSEFLEKQRLNDIIQQQRMEQELVNAENAFLKAQINPHFLFNTLDFIYHQVHDSSPEAGEALIDLSNMMRYAMDSGRNAGVEVVGKEIEQVETLINLYQLRKRGKYCIEFQATDEVRELYLIPLVLLTLVENVFKHGELLDEENPASIRLWVADGQLHICTNNGIAASNYTIKSGHGLVNTANRLHFAYGEHATLKSEQVNWNFLVQLSVPVDLLQRPAPPVPSSIKIDRE
jgi:sensor histidine kinase YesM